MDTVANLLPNASPRLTPVTAEVYISDGLPPIPPALAAKICRGAFVGMGELLPEFWAVSRVEDSSMRADTKIRRSCKVTDIFTWLQTYVSVLAPLYPERVPELMAYMTTIIRASQDFTGMGPLQLSIPEASGPNWEHPMVHGGCKFIYNFLYHSSKSHKLM